MKPTKGSNKKRKAPSGAAGDVSYRFHLDGYRLSAVVLQTTAKKSKSSSSSRPAGNGKQPQQPKKLKLRDQKVIPVPQSAFLGKTKVVAGEGAEEDGGEEEEEEEIDMEDMLGEGEDSGDEEQGEGGGIQEGGGRATAGLEFLVGLDAKNLSR
jgi:nucleolar complex protein 3